MKTPSRPLHVVLATLCAIANLHGDSWTASYLDPLDSGSEINATAGYRQVGYANYGFGAAAPRATLWFNGFETPLTYNLHPSAARSSVINATTGTQQAGFATFGTQNTPHACLWTDSSESFTDLHPAGARDSMAYSTSGTQQAGYATLDTIVPRTRRNIAGPPVIYYENLGPNRHAAIWSLSASSFIDLHPAWLGGSAAVYSVITSTTGAKQAGYIGIEFGGEHAALWSGSSANVVDLNPVGASGSRALAITGTHQAGYATIGSARHAAIWTGSADSFVDLHPTGAINSCINAIRGNLQAGYVEPTSGTHHATVWFGTAANPMNLHTLLSADHTSSDAQCIWSDGNEILVGGRAYNVTTKRLGAVVWRFTPSPADRYVAFSEDRLTTLVARPGGQTAMLTRYSTGSRGIKELFLFKREPRLGCMSFYFDRAGNITKINLSKGLSVKVEPAGKKLAFTFRNTKTKKTSVVYVRNPDARRSTTSAAAPLMLESAISPANQRISPFRLRPEMFTGLDQAEVAQMPIVGPQIADLLENSFKGVNNLLNRVVGIATKGGNLAGQVGVVIKGYVSDGLGLWSDSGDELKYKLPKIAWDLGDSINDTRKFWQGAAKTPPNFNEIRNLCNKTEDLVNAVTEIPGLFVKGETVTDDGSPPASETRNFSISGAGGAPGTPLLSTSFRKATMTGTLSSLRVDANVTSAAENSKADVSVTLTANTVFTSSTETTQSSITYNWKGTLYWDGKSFSGYIARTDTSGRPDGYISILHDTERNLFYAGVSLPLTYFIETFENGQRYTQPLQTTTYSPESFWLPF